MDIVPRRGRQGPKDFAPDGTAAQKTKLEAAHDEFRILREVPRLVAV